MAKTKANRNEEIPTTGDTTVASVLTRRNFMKYSVGTLASIYMGTTIYGCGNSTTTSSPAPWPISKDVYTTVQKQVLPVPVSSAEPQINPRDLKLYGEFGYSAWRIGPGLPCTKWESIAPDYAGAPNAALLLSFFAMTDIHIADKESPAQPLYVGWMQSYGPASYGLSSAFSPVLLASTHVLDAAIQTINALHKKTPFDFGISLGDATNNTQYNELRWYIDVIDGKIITPSSGSHIGADTIDYQKPFQAAGLDKSIPWYQVIGNHDQFWMGSSCEDEKTLAAHVSNQVLNMDNSPDPSSGAVDRTGYYMGVIDGADPLGAVILSGPQENFATPPTVVADPDRRSLATRRSTTLNWMKEFFSTSSNPVGHGFTQANLDNDFACYSFMPKSAIPVKIIVLDDTCKGPGQPNYAAGCIDQARLDWLKNELQGGQDNNQLMIIAAHIPFRPYKNLVIDPVQVASSPPFMSLFIPKPYPGATSVVSDTSLLAILQNYPNLIMWISGHRHMNTITPQIHPTDPTRSFWEVETASLRDFPQQFRTFRIYRNSDNTISIIVTNVDPAVAPVSPATTSRGNAIAAARIFGATPSIIADATSRAVNAELVIQLTPEMQTVIAGAGTPVNP
ncbi:TIGR03768 family metallophosphoesterase [Geotalea sp. SG265]|uniref:TIGR03768 family metallophosphoesterase n=1 Tax=Geotalea sp. SG265 TaxID=2922867 RepID=UPI001FB020E8|nr:TIGR03768 family metallophosphoesterase [Geotalea sp. SG265]